MVFLIPQYSFGQQLPQQQNDQNSSVLYVANGATVYGATDISNVKIVKIKTGQKQNIQKSKISVKRKVAVFAKKEVKQSPEKFAKTEHVQAFKFLSNSSDQDIQASGGINTKFSVNNSNYTGKAFTANHFLLAKKLSFYKVKSCEFRSFSKMTSLVPILSIRPPPVI